MLSSLSLKIFFIVYIILSVLYLREACSHPLEGELPLAITEEKDGFIDWKLYYPFSGTIVDMGFFGVVGGTVSKGPWTSVADLNYRVFLSRSTKGQIYLVGETSTFPVFLGTVRKQSFVFLGRDLNGSRILDAGLVIQAGRKWRYRIAVDPMTERLNHKSVLFGYVRGAKPFFIRGRGPSDAYAFLSQRGRRAQSIFYRFQKSRRVRRKRFKTKTADWQFFDTIRSSNGRDDLLFWDERKITRVSLSGELVSEPFQVSSGVVPRVVHIHSDTAQSIAWVDGSNLFVDGVIVSKHQTLRDITLHSTSKSTLLLSKENIPDNQKSPLPDPGEILGLIPTVTSVPTPVATIEPSPSPTVLVTPQHVRPTRPPVTSTPKPSATSTSTATPTFTFIPTSTATPSPMWTATPTQNPYLHNVEKLSKGARGETTCAITTDNEMFCWGKNSLGLVGAEDTLDSLVPRKVAGTWKEISFGIAHACGINTSGELYCWGGGAYGRLGIGDTQNYLELQHVSSITDTVVSVSCGEQHTCAITTSGKLYCWGRNIEGQVGDGSFTQRNLPVEITGLTATPLDVQLGYRHSCAHLSDNSIWCWGNNSSGRLGDGTQINRESPVRVVGLSSGTIQGLRVGADSGVALFSDDKLEFWGNNSNGTFGNGTTSNSIAPIAGPSFSSPIRSLSSGRKHSCVSLINGEVYCWGLNERGQVGNGGVEDSFVPSRVIGLEDTSNIRVYSYNKHSCAITAQKEVLCWGDNMRGELGIGSQILQTTATKVLRGEQ